jgi:hypothetical protein
MIESAATPINASERRQPRSFALSFAPFRATVFEEDECLGDSDTFNVAAADMGENLSPSSSV